VRAERFGDAPVRLLDAFVALQDGKLRGLDALEGGADAPRVTLCVEGVLRAPGRDANPSPDDNSPGLRVQLDAVTDWCVDYVRGGVCLITPHAWYRLLRPHAAYAPLFLHTRRKCELAVRAAAALDAAPLASYETVLAHILAPPTALGAAAPEDGCDSGSAYALSSLLADARFMLNQLTEAVPRTRDALSRPATFIGRLAEAVAALDPPQPPQLEPQHPAPRFDASVDEGVLVLRAEALLSRMDWRGGGGGKRARVAARRGPPPSGVDAAFGLDAFTAGDVLLLWDFFGAFADFLRVPPLPLSRLVAALCPDADLAATDAGAASGALLRDLHAALLRCVAGKDLEVRAAPLVAVAEGPPAGVPWPQAARAALLAAPADVVGPDALAAAAALQDGDYAELSAPQRVALLRGLQAVAIEGEAFREQMAMRAEDGEAAAEPLPWEDGSTSASAAVDVARPWDAWTAWAARVAPAAGRPLGSDLEGRRYWLLGGAPGWGRVFVEEPGARGGGDPGTWLCYTWTQLPALAAWLQAGGQKSAAERALLRTLRRLPQPPPAAAAGWDITAACARTAAGGEGPDGYAGLVAPLLRGSATAAPGSGAAGVDAQVRACVQALLAAVPFWELDSDALARFRLLHAAASGLQAGPTLAVVLHDLEALMTSANALTAEWPQRRAGWRADAARCTSLAAAALPVAQLQDHLAKDPARLTRDAFLRLMRAEQLVPPFAPAEGQTVVLARTGLQRHCDTLGFSVDPQLWAALRLTERFRAVCVAFRRGDETKARLRGFHAAWVLLEPARDALSHLGGGFARGLCVPVVAGLKNTLDCVLDAEAFDRSLLRPWAVGDRFRTFFPSGGPEILPGRRPGSWFKGTVSRVHLHVELSAAGPGGCERHVDVDPWEAYEVEWDHEKRRERREFANDLLCPWQLEAPEGLEKVQAIERRAKEDEHRRHVELAAQAAHSVAVQHRVYAAPEAMDDQPVDIDSDSD
jgi:hypothetical protein